MGFNFKTTSRLLLSHKRQLEILSIKNYWILVDKKRTLNEVCRRPSLHSLGIYQWYYSLRTLGPFLQRLSRKCARKRCFSFWSLNSNYPLRIPLGRPVQRLTLFFNKLEVVLKLLLCARSFCRVRFVLELFFVFETKFFPITRWRVWLDQKSTPSLYSKTPSYIRCQYVRLFIFPKP